VHVLVGDFSFSQTLQDFAFFLGFLGFGLVSESIIRGFLCETIYLFPTPINIFNRNLSWVFPFFFFFVKELRIITNDIVR
jgi:hypothetical protein